MKKLLKIAAVLSAILVVLLLAAYITLKIMFPAEKLKTMAQTYVKNTFNRELTFSSVSFNLVGITVHDVALSEAQTFEQGTFVQAENAVIKLKLLPLLKRNIDIDTVGLNGLQVNVIKNQDGTFNFDDLSNAQNQSETEPEKTANDSGSPFFNVLAKNIYAKDCVLNYTDLAGKMKASITNLNLNIQDFDLVNPFDVKLNFSVDYQDPEKTFNLPIKSKLTVHLANLDNEQAYVTLQNLQTEYKQITVDLKGGIKNFNQPILNLQGAISGISSDALSEVAPDLPHFALPDIAFNIDAETDLDKSTAHLTQAKLSVADSFLTVNGQTGWGEKDATYNLKTDLNLDLSQLGSMSKLLDGYGMGGKIVAQLTATDKNNGQDVKGNIVLKQVAVQYPPISVTDFSGDIVLVSLANISSKALTGKLNNEPFSASFAYKNLGKVIDLVFNADLTKLTIADWQGEPETDSAKETPAATQEQNGPETLFNLRANVNIGPIEVPYLSSNGAKLTANLKNASGSMKQANGTVNFNFEEGSLNDLFTSIQDNKIIRIIFLPLKLVQKVTSTLGVNIFPVKEEKDKGKIKIKDASGTYVFTDGVMNLQETHLDSALSNITATGNINFKTEALDMRVKASVLTSQTPIVVKIGGTMSNPSGKLDITQTAVSLVTGIVNYKTPGAVAGSAVGAASSVANTGVDTVKSTVNTAASAVKSIGSLFKKSNTEKESSAQDTSAESKK